MSNFFSVNKDVLPLKASIYSFDLNGINQFYFENISAAFYL